MRELGSTSSDRRVYDFAADRRGVSTGESYLEKVTVASAEGIYKLSRTPRLPYPSGESQPSLNMSPMTMEEFGRSLSYN